MSNKKIFLLIIFLLSSLLAVGQNTDSTIILNNTKDLLNIGKHAYFFEDKEGKLTIEDIQKPEYQKKFKKTNKESLNFNLTATASKIWIKFTVSNQTDEKTYLEIAHSVSPWYIDFYKPDVGGKPVLSTQTGMMRPMKNREVDNNFFLFKLDKKPQAQTYYFSIQSEYSLIITMTLGTGKSLLEKSSPSTLFFGGFSGLMLIMLFYNLFVYFSVRDKTYLYYCVYVVVNMFGANFFSGNYGHHWNILSYFPNYPIPFLFLGNSLFLSLFLVNLLDIPKKAIFYKILMGFVLVYFIAAMLNLITGHYRLITKFTQMSMLLTYSYILFYAIYQYIKGKTNFRFVVFGFSFYLIGSIIYILRNFGILPNNFFTNNALVLGISVEVLMFSLALGDRINQMRREKEISQNALLAQTQENEKLVREQNIVLEQKVQERTIQLNQQKEEIQIQAEQLGIANNTKDKLFSIIGHDLRAPVASLIGLLDLIAGDYVTQKEFKALAPTSNAM